MDDASRIALEKDAEVLSRDVFVLSGIIAEKKKELEEIETKKRLAREDFDKTVGLHNEFRNSSSLEIQNILSEKAKVSAELSETRKNFEEEKSFLVGRKRDLLNEIDSLKKEISALHNEIAVIKKEISDLESKKENLKIKYERDKLTKEKQLSVLQKKISELSPVVSSLEEGLKIKRDEFIKLEKESKRINELLEQREESVRRKEKDLLAKSSLVDGFFRLRQKG